jgi:hypothetical protein
VRRRLSTEDEERDGCSILQFQFRLIHTEVANRTMSWWYIAEFQFRRMHTEVANRTMSWWYTAEYQFR